MTEFSLEPSTSTGDPQFSVIVPTLNVARTLGRCLTSLIEAKEASLEIILVDDASSDETIALAQSFPVRLIRAENNLGPAGARNLGAQQARGEILVFVDADITVEADVFARLKAFFRQHPHAAAVSGVYSTNCPAQGFFARYKNYYLVHSYSWMSGRIGALNTSLAAVKKAVFLQIGGFDPQWREGEDTILGSELTLTGHAVYLDPDLQMRHLKEYTFVELIKDDFVKAYYMAKYLLGKTSRLPTLLFNRQGHHHSATQMIKVPAAYLLLISAFFLLLRPYGLTITAFVPALFFFSMLNASLWIFIRRNESRVFAISAIMLHFIEMLVAGGAIIVAFLALVFRSRP